MKRSFRKFLALAMAVLVLWAGNGYGVMEHSCEEHGKHRHILTHWGNTACEHEHQHDAEPPEPQTDGYGFHTSHQKEQASFVHFYAETLSKTSGVSTVTAALFQAVLSSSFHFHPTGFTFKIHTSSAPIFAFRRTFGRSLLTWVQSFLI